jgi:hypothetical protein
VINSTPNPEIPGGSIALVAISNNMVQEPPNALGRMHACREKQTAFNKSVLKNEEETVATNSGLQIPDRNEFREADLLLRKWWSKDERETAGLPSTLDTRRQAHVSYQHDVTRHRYIKRSSGAERNL